jgi:hypothetical protein
MNNASEIAHFKKVLQKLSNVRNERTLLFVIQVVQKNSYFCRP